MDKDIEFTVDIGNDWLTCGWLLSEVTRKYTEALQKIKGEKAVKSDGKSTNVASGTAGVETPTNKQIKKKFIVALKTTDQRESLDYLLTQYERYAYTYHLFIFLDP